jgi:glycerol-3-phosphate acyltransferase PlsY
VYTGFRGGKGVATGAGMLAVIAPYPTACAVCVFALTLFTFGKVSLASILAAISLPVAVLLIGRYTSVSYPTLLLALMVALAAFIVITHRSNIRRLIQGQEKSFPKLQLWKRILPPRR